MKLYVWRHNKTYHSHSMIQDYHSHSMIQEPCVNTEFYLDAIAIVAAESLEEALKLLEEQHKGWRTEDLRELEPTVYSLDEGKVIFTELRGSIA